MPWITGKAKNKFQSERLWLKYPCLEDKVSSTAIAKRIVKLMFTTVGRTRSNVSKYHPHNNKCLNSS
jgi:hypothetical protein